MRYIETETPKRRTPYLTLSIACAVLLFIATGCGGSSAIVGGPPPSPPPPPDPTIVTTQSGQVQGVIDGDMIVFRGIPYAAPPTGNLRWKPPAAVASWQGIRSASSFGNKCPQLDANSNPIGDEDCLTLNVFISDPPPKTKQPVMVFIHGGGNTGGDEEELPLSLPLLAGDGVVVVTIEYRLGLLGFLAHPLLTAEGGGSSGNYGLMDQIAALGWIKKNISAFGGDPTRVMLFGESAGAIDVEPLLVSPMAQGLFARAGMESQGLETGDVLSLDASAAFYAPSITPLGCDNSADVLACLRAVPATTLVTALQIPPIAGTTAGPISPPLTLEPNVIPIDPFLALQGNGSPVPLLIGSNATEMTVFFSDLTSSLSELQYVVKLDALFQPLGPDVPSKVIALYPSSDYNSMPNVALAHVRSDYYLTCKSRKVALAVAGAQRPAVWRYFFTHTLENPASSLNGLGAFHFEEVPFVFGNFQNIFGVDYAPTSAELQLSSAMMGYWTRFAATGDPNGAGAVQWLPYDNTNENVLQLDDTIETISGYHKDQCDYFDTLPPPPV